MLGPRQHFDRGGCGENGRTSASRSPPTDETQSPLSGLVRALRPGRTSPPGHSRLIDGEPAAAAPPPPAVEFRANQINRCSDGAGGQLQDTPCARCHTPSRRQHRCERARHDRALGAAATTDRAGERSRQARRRCAEALAISPVVGRKLGCSRRRYGVFRLIRSWRDAYAFKEASRRRRGRSRQ